MKFSEYLRGKRKELGYRSQESLAKRLGIHYMTVQKWELDKALPSLEKIKPLANALQTTDTFLFDMIMPNAPKSTLYYYDTANKINDIKAGKIFGATNKLPMDKKLLDSFVFKINSNFMKPVIEKGQRAIISYSAPINTGSYVILEIQCKEGNYTKKLQTFKKGNNQWLGVSIKDGIDSIFGRLLKKENNYWKIGGTVEKKSYITVNTKDIELKARIMGILL